LEYFATSKVLTRRQARWSEHLAEFNFKVICRPSEKNTKKDVLSRRWDNGLKEGSEASPVSFFQTFPESKRIRWFRSPSGSDEKRRRRPSGFDGQDCRDSEWVFEGTADGIVVSNSISIAAAKEIELSKAFLDLPRQVGEKDPD
jgi:hypothetical protein